MFYIQEISQNFYLLRASYNNGRNCMAISTHPGCMGEQQTKFATSHFNEAGVKDFACKIQQ
jgi:hypothetical protein